MPKTNKIFWDTKIARNIIRDKERIDELRELGWNVYTIWECDLKPKKILTSLNELVVEISKNKNT
jgi:DNA mismatch endonuclease (patch repair protein)